MKIKILLLVFLLTGGNHGLAQKGLDVLKRKNYMVKTYGISMQKAETYEELRKNLLAENEELKKQKVPSSQFRIVQKKLYKKYGDQINKAFYNGKYRMWSFCTQELECYQMLCDIWFVPYETMRALHKVEVNGKKRRKQILISCQEEVERLKKKEVFRNELDQTIRKLLGEEAGNWYIEYKKLYLVTLRNMDTYKASFRDAHAIAEIESKFHRKRRAILQEQKSKMEKEINFMKLEEEKIAKIMSAVPSDVSGRWKKVNMALLDYNLTSKYSLTQTQVEQFKKAYSKYSVEEYKIMHAKKVAKTDKYTQLSTLSDNFCKSVASLFQIEQYKKWHGWWQYKIEKKIKNKGLK